jgi:predicted glycosyltransferase
MRSLMSKVLFVSGSVGLGHVQRDVRIARELMALRRDAAVVWLAGDPATRVLEEEGMVLLPECQERDVGASVIESVARGPRVSMTEVLYRVRKEDRYAQAVRAFDALVERERPDLVVADEAYELEGAHAQGAGRDWPPFVFLWDFVKVYPGSWRWRDVRTARLVNKGWDRAFRKGREAGWTDLFLGEPDDVPDERLGIGMVNARRGAEGRYHFVGNPLPFDPAGYADRAAVRARLGYGQGRLLICSTGGTAVGADLLRLCLRAVPLMRASAPDLKVLVVKGPRMEADLGEVPPGVEVRGYVPRLFEHFAAADMAIVQGGGTSTLELAALRVPFLYFPLKGHSEQEVNVARKLERNGLGIKCDIARTSPGELASLVLGNIGKVPGPPALSFDGCRNAARAIASLL